jgi:hypothetical protein
MSLENPINRSSGAPAVTHKNASVLEMITKPYMDLQDLAGLIER